tara:strand:- start:212 stop:508 length:297 start_codon:yes stop_codon:yes gene_type:complete
MSKNYKKIINEKKKYVFLILIFIFLIYFVTNFIYSFFQNKILSILNSSRFEKFIILRVENYLEKISEGELTEKQIEYYSNVLNRINQKFKPVLDKLKN